MTAPISNSFPVRRPLLDLDVAVDTVLRAAVEMRESRPVSTRAMGLWEASGYILAEDVRADRDAPGFDKSMMDGFAIRTADLTGEVTDFVVTGEIAAGGVPSRALAPGEAMAIMTGAPVPDGADAVAIVEICERQGESVRVRARPRAGENITRRGTQARVGDVVVEAGRVIENLTAGVLGSVGAASVKVFRRPRVSVYATGDELVNIEDTPGPAQIRDSNRRTLISLLEGEWGRVVDGGIVRDERAELRRAILEGLESDVLVLSGGVSAGTYDLVRESLEAEGVDILFHQIAIKPGKPVLFGRTERCLVFGLPGNPVSSFVTATMLVAPALRVLGRRPEHRTWMLDLPILGELPASERRTTFHPGELVRGAGSEVSVRALGWDGSADHIAYARANVLIRRSPGMPAAAPGDRVCVVLPRGLAAW